MAGATLRDGERLDPGEPLNVQLHDQLGINLTGEGIGADSQKVVGMGVEKLDAQADIVLHVIAADQHAGRLSGFANMGNC